MGASGMALLLSGNCLDLLHTKALPRCAWIVFLTAVAVFHGGILAASNGAWGAVDIARLAAVVSFAIGAALLLVCRTARSYADAVVPWFACAALSLLLTAGMGGWYGEVAARAPLFVALLVTMQFRRKYTVVVFVVIILLIFPLGALADCAFENIRGKTTYGGCVVLRLQSYRTLFFVSGFLAVFFVGRKYANDLSARHTH
eukprot:CAMPEP_0180234248 /NCGR_PEP_ID=MMETSP0987-20121128/28549_1 /TAXON_ID=697907 /ORGANISM="non described non described, Strain CCMP2293" /LENGTH=200 /DNA_ID=CAMNT_0022200203 /DNA_START=164 /DNA_END=766 /DNA_ORIENTATION=+